MPFILIYTTHKDLASAKQITDALLQNKMIACVNFFPISSEYHWKGEIASSNEIVAILKTTKTNWPKVRDFIEENHPYETPCIIKLGEVEANQGYADWVQGEVV